MRLFHEAILFSEIAPLPNTPEIIENKLISRLSDAYLAQRKQCERMELELNRSKILIVDSNGKIVHLNWFGEH
jgi:hypothetical protein